MESTTRRYDENVQNVIGKQEVLENSLVITDVILGRLQYFLGYWMS
jgi:hypothetical protein